MIEIRGRVLLPSAFISGLDGLPLCLIGSDYRTKSLYYTMRRLIQILADDYSKGLDEIGSREESIFRTYDFPLPGERSLPAAFCELFSTMERKLGVDFSSRLEKWELWSHEMVREDEEMLVKENERLQTVKKLLQENGIDVKRGQSTLERIRNLITLEKAKRASLVYQEEEREERVTHLWCTLLLSSLLSDYLTYGEAESVVENGILTEEEVTDLLKNRYGMEKDWEWYSEDYLGSCHEKKTAIRFSDVFEKGQKRVDEVLGAGI